MFDSNPTDANRKMIDDIMLFDQTSIVEPDPEGTPEQALLSGIINAQDTASESEGMTDERFIAMCFEHYDNMGYSK